MRTFARAAVALAIAAAAVPSIRPAVAAAPVQTVEGAVALPTRFAQDATYTSWPFVQRNVYVATEDNGHVGYTFPVDPRAVGGDFTVEVTGGSTGDEDVDVTWYASLDPSVSPGGSTERSANGEKGTIPSGTKFGIVTLFHGANAEFVFKGYAPVKKAASAPADNPPLPAKPGIYPNFGKGDTEWAQRLRSKSHVVVAVVDTGINPYHLAYRAPEYAVHPSEYIEGFPKDTPAIGLTFGNDYVKSRQADDPNAWSKVQEKKLYWIPGTNIIGGYSVKDYFDPTPELGDVLPEGIEHSRPIIDDSGHGTGTTSVSTGRSISPTRKEPFGSNPEALVVIIEGLGTEGVKWASEQPWIDFVSGSYGDPASVPYNDTSPDVPAGPDPVGEVQGREYRYTAPFVLRDGRTACFSAGNGASRTGVATDRYSSIRPTSGPSWVVTVGAVSPRNGQDYGWHSVPVDISSYGLHWAAAAPFSVDGEQDFSGTSNATPVVCGAFSKALLEARRALGDAREGLHVSPDGTGVPALGPIYACLDAVGISCPTKQGPISDGVLTREELQKAVFNTAMPAELDPVSFSYEPVVIPHTPAYYTQEGYGIGNAASGRRAADVLLGKTALPDRAEVDSWIAQVDSIRNAIWAPPSYPKFPVPKPSGSNNGAPKKPAQKKPVVKGARLAATGVADEPWLPVLLLCAAAFVVRRLRSPSTSR